MIVCRLILFALVIIDIGLSGLQPQSFPSDATFVRRSASLQTEPVVLGKTKRDTAGQLEQSERETTVVVSQTARMDKIVSQSQYRKYAVKIENS